MELPNDSTLNDELSEMCINTALDILLERAENGDEEALRAIEKVSDDCRAALRELERQDQKREGLNA